MCSYEPPSLTLRMKSDDWMISWVLGRWNDRTPVANFLLSSVRLGQIAINIIINLKKNNLDM